MAHAKKAASLQTSIANYQFDTSNFIRLKPLTPMTATPAKSGARLIAKKPIKAKAKANA